MKQRLTRFWPALCLFGVSIFGLWSCNISESENSTILRLRLEDSLSVERGQFDSVVVDIFDDFGNKTHAAIFAEAYDKTPPATDSLKLHNLVLSPKAPDPLVIHITAYKLKKPLLRFETHLKGNETTTKVFDISGAPPDTTDTIPLPDKVESVSIAPSKVTLYTGGAEGKLTVAVAVSGSAQKAAYNLSSSDTTIATVDSEGKVKTIKAGEVLITAKAGSPAVSGVCSVSVITDPPVPTVSGDQSVVYGGEAGFTVKVAKQAYGEVVSIKADMDGDGILESVVLGKSTVDFKRVYESSTTIRFEVTDTEGNTVVVNRKVVVSSPGAPLVDIIHPSTDTTITTDTFKIRFVYKDSLLAIDRVSDSTVTLDEGQNTIRVVRSNDGGESADEVVITLDRTGPARPEFIPWTGTQNPSAGNRPIWKWTAVSDAAKYQLKMDDADTTQGMINVLSGMQYQPSEPLPDGPHTLYLRALDASGNASAVANLKITVNAVPPAKPIVVDTPASPTASRTPVWKWKSGDADQGNGKYQVRLNGILQSIADAPTFTGDALGDGKYVLKVRELDDAGMESAETTFPEIIVDGTRPVITVSGRTSGDAVSLATVRSATLQGSIVEAGSSALLSATWELSGGTTKAASAITTPGSFSINTGILTNASATTLTIRAKDGAQNAATFTVVFNVNVAPPTLAFVSPTPEDGHVSNGPITVYYKVDNGPTQDTVLNVAAPATGETSTPIPFSIKAENEGGVTTLSRTFYRVNANVRFFTSLGTPSGDCSSWARACKFGGDMSALAGKVLWLQSGQYDITDNPFNLGKGTVFGGIKANGKGVMDRSGETVIFSTLESTGQSHLSSGSELTKVTITGVFSWHVFSLDLGSTHKFVECTFRDLTANSSSASHGTLMASENLRFERCIFDNTGGNGAFLIGNNGGDPIFFEFKDCTFIPSQPNSNFSSDFERWVNPEDPWYSYRFYNPTGTPRMQLDGVCGLPGSPACPP